MTERKTPAVQTPTSMTPNVADAIRALMNFLQNGSQTPDPQEFDDRQQGIERDFRPADRAQAGHQRATRSDRQPGALTRSPVIGAALPAEAHTIAGFTRDRKQVWSVTVVDAIHNTDPRNLQHDDIVIRKIYVGRVARLRAFDVNGQLILIGYPRIVDVSPATGKAI